MAHKRFSSEFKAKAALEAIKGEKTMVQLSSQYKVHAPQINTWKRQAPEARPAYRPAPPERCAYLPGGGRSGLMPHAQRRVMGYVRLLHWRAQ